MRIVEIFTDGSCFLNDSGRGGYGALLQCNGTIKEIYGGYLHTTNNRMELLAVIKGLEILKEPCNVVVYSDSRYVTEAINRGWILNWIKKDFKGIKNPDLWKQLIPHLQTHSIQFSWVKGHADCVGNNRADELAAMGASSQPLIKDNVFT